MSEPLEITVLYGVDIVYQTFQAVAAIMQNDGYHTLLVLAESIGVIACTVKYIKTHDLKTFGLWGLLFVIVSAVLLTPTKDVVIRDLATPAVVKKVDNVPVGLAAPFWLVTSIGNGTARMYDTFFAQPDELQYTRTGLLFGQKLLQDSYTLGIRDPEFNMNFGDYTNNCIVPDMQLNNKYSVSDLFNDNKVYERIFSNASPVRGIFYKFAGGGDAQYMTCKDAAARLLPILEKEAGNPNSATLKQLAGKYAVGENGQTNNILLPGRIDSVYSNMIGSSQGAVDILKQNIATNALRHSLSQYPAAMDGTADLINNASQQSLMKMKLAQLSSYEIAGEMLPMMHTAFLTLMIGIFPIMVLALFVKELSWAVVKNYLNVLGSLMLWAVMFAIFNHVINTLSAQTLHGKSFSLSVMDTEIKNASSLAGYASWLMLTIPFISMKLFTGLSQQIASAGSYLGNALMSATSADAAAVSHGNYNMGNMSLQNVNGFKTDLNQSYRAGMSSMQTETGGMVTTTESGQVIYEANMSKLPMKLDTSSVLDSSFSKAMSAQQRETASYQEGYRSSVTDSYNAATALSNNFARSGDMESGLTKEQRDSIEQVRRQSQEAQNSQSSSDYTSNDYLTSTRSTDTGAVGARASAGASLGGKSTVNAGADVSGSYSHSWEDSNQDTAAYGNRTSEDKRVSENFSDSKSAQVIKNMSDSDIARIRDSESRSLVYDLRSSLNRASENYAGYSESLSKEKTISQQANLTESSRLSASESLEHEFAQFVTRKEGKENAINILTDAGSPELRERREQLKDEFTDKIASDIKNGHFDNEAKVVASYNGMNVQADAGKYSAAGYKENSKNLAGKANEGGVIRNITTMDIDGNRQQQSLLDGVNYSMSSDGQASQQEQAVRLGKVAESSNLADVHNKVAENKNEIAERKGLNKHTYDDKS
ncbi:conjugal transfer mating-pair stabilization protein TraG [Morganella morganii]|uniref:conjugal transfer mating-pair stabilization protein TraG n=1 Tax=Morganella morganii TaxID=582 RepID=UPI0034BFA3A0